MKSSRSRKRRLDLTEVNPLDFQKLEDRHLLAGVVVTNATDLTNANTTSITALMADDGGDGVSLREAVIASNNTIGLDTITFDASVFTGGADSLIRLTQGELEITEALTINGSAGTDIVITADATGDDVTVFGTFITDVAASFGEQAGDVSDLLDDNSRVINFSGVADSTLTLSALSVTGGRTTDGFPSVREGAGIHASSGNISLTDITLSGNSTSGDFALGGGIYAFIGSVSLTNSEVSRNSTNGLFSDGGGISTRNGDVSLVNSTVVNNSTRDSSFLNPGGFGGGIRTLNGGNVTLINSTVSGNNGGGILVEDGDVALTDSTVSENGGSSGTGILASGGDVSLINSTVSGNGGINYGGGGISATRGDVSLINSTVSGNGAGGDGANGGGILANSTIRIINSTITDNSASGVGGGIMAYDAIGLTLINSIVAGNTDSSTAPDLKAPVDVGNNLAVEHSLIGDSTGSGITSSTGTGNILGQPALLGPLANNGGPTLTHRLLSGSPAINAGNDTLAVDTEGAPLSSDQRGSAFNRINVGTIDIGATESNFDSLSPPTVVSATINEGGVLVRPDLWNTLTVVFDSDVAVTADALTLFNDAPFGFAIDLSGIGFDYDSSTNTATWDFSALDNALEPGYYTYRVNANSVTSGSLTLDGNGDGIRGDDVQNQHYVALRGDANLDGTVDVLNDAAALISNLNTSTGASWADGDFNGDGDFTVLGDAALLIRNLNRDLELLSEVVVTNATDLVNADTSSIPILIANDGGDGVSLREAILASNNTTGANTVTFDTSVFTGGIDRVIRLAQGELEITDTLTIDASMVTDLTITGDANGDDITIAQTLITDVAASFGETPAASDDLLDDNTRVFNFSSATGDLLLSDLTITGGRTTGYTNVVRDTTYNGGGIRFDSHGSISLNNTIVSGNSTAGSRNANGGGIATSSGTLSLTNSTVSGNSTAGILSGGGGIYSFDGAVSLLNSTVSENSSAGNSASGGGIFSSYGQVSLTSSTVSGNSTAGSNSNGGGISASSVALVNSSVEGNNTAGRSSFGGGIFGGSGGVSLTNSTVSGNSTKGVSGGGGIGTSSGTVSLVDSTVSGNRAAGSGGGIDTSSGTVLLTNSTVSGNSTTDGGDGGGIDTRTGTVSLMNSTVSGNSTAGDNADGGGIKTSSGSVSLTNSTVSGNSANGFGSSGGGVFVNRFLNTDIPVITIDNSIVAGNTDDSGNAADLHTADSTLMITHSLIGVNEGTPLSAAPVGLPDASGNLIGTEASPVYPQLGPLADNGGPTLTHALLSNSPAIDAGNSALTMDQRGILRPYDFTSIANPLSGNGSDIGATELQMAASFFPTSVTAVAETRASLDLSSAVVINEEAGGNTTVKISGAEVAFATPSDGSGVGDGVTATLVDSQTITLVGAAVDITAYLDSASHLQYVPAVGVIGENATVIDVVVASGSESNEYNIDVAVFEKESLLVTTATDVVDIFDGVTSLREAINVANVRPNIDTITFDGSVFTGGAASVIRVAEGSLSIREELTIDGSTGTDVVISGDVNGDDITVDGTFITDVAASFGGTTGAADDLVDDNSLVLSFSRAETGVLSLSHITVTGGSQGGIRTRSGHVSLTNSTVSGNLANSSSGGGGIYSRAGDIFLTDSVVSGNSTEGRGGGIRTSSGNVSLINTTVSGNSTTGNQADGGGILAYYGAVTLTNSTVSGNITSGENSNGGGIWVSFGSISLTNSTIHGNKTNGNDSDGGGLFTRSGDVTLTKSTISGNKTSGASSHGGGIYARSGDVLITSSTLSGNLTYGSFSNGGGIWTDDSTLLIANSTVTENSASGIGGGIRLFTTDSLDSADLTIISSIVAGNTDNGTAPDFSGTNLVESGRLVVDYSLIGDTTGSGVTATTGIGNILNQAALLDSLADNGGPTQTHAPLANSPAIDAGDSTFTGDQRGFMRPIDFASVDNFVGVSGTDMGAFELQSVNAFFPRDVFSVTDATSRFDLSSALVFDDQGPNATVTLKAASGAFSTPADGSGLGEGVVATLIDPQTVTIFGAVADINSYLNNTSSLQYTPTAGTVGDNATTITVLVDSDETRSEFSINVDISGLLVNTTTDADNLFGEVTSLRDAINFANLRPGADTITFDSSVFTGASNSLIRLTLGQLEITDSLKVDATTGTRVVITGDADGDDALVGDTFTTNLLTSGADQLDDNGRVLEISATADETTLIGLTITGGQTTGNNVESDTTYSGGGIRFLSGGTLNLIGSTVSGNSTTGDRADGGGIHALSGEVTLTNSTVSGNRVVGSEASGGGVSMRNGSVSLANTTVTENHATVGGGISLDPDNHSSSEQLTVVSSIVAGNTDSGTAPDFLAPAGGTNQLSVSSSLIGDNSGTSLVIASVGSPNNEGNLIGLAGDQINPLLSPLADNGGLTPTHALLPNSPAIDAGNSNLTTDQRGFMRPLDFASISNVNGGDGSDIGAFELQTLATAFPSDVLVLADSTSIINLSSALVIDEDGDNTNLTLNAITGAFSAPADGSDVGGGVTATLVDPQTVTLTGLAVDINRYLDSVSNLQYTPAAGRVGVNATTISVSVDTGDVPSEFSINVDIVEQDSLLVTSTIDVESLLDGVTSLREAINFANVRPGVDTITFDPIVFNGDANSLIRLRQGELQITDALTIDGATGTGVVVSGDRLGNDRSIAGTFVTDVEASGAGRLDDNSRVFNFSGSTGTLSLSDLTVTGGRTHNDLAPGGGIYSSVGDVVLTNSTVSGNSTSGDFASGGGIYASSGDVWLIRSTVSNNSTDGDLAAGGGIASYSGIVSVTNSTLSGNDVRGDSASGGGIWSSDTVLIVSSTITDNSASGVAGGIGFDTADAHDEAFTLINSIVAGNTDNGTAPDLATSFNAMANHVVEHSLIGNTTGSGITTATGTGNILDQSAMLGPLTDNGGSTLTHALLPGSPAIDTGSDEALIDPGIALATDQRGIRYVRTFDDPSVLGFGIDIGAFERQTLTLVVDNQVDAVDGDRSAGRLSLREAIALANGSMGPDTITFDGSVFTGGEDSVIRLTLGELVITEEVAIVGTSGTEVLITGDADNNDVTFSDTIITDVAASLAAGYNSLSDNSRLINFSSVGGTLTLDSLTLTGGQASDGGGGIRASDGAVSLINSTVSGNSTNRNGATGGGIHTESGDVFLLETTVSMNSTSGYGASGGGIYAGVGDVSIVDSTVSGNGTSGASAEGGGIFAPLGSVSLLNSTLSGNWTSGGDGFSRNRADGGGIRTFSGAVSLINSILSENSAAAASGGGIATDSGNVLLTDSTVSGNSADGSGGGVGTSSGNVTLDNSTLSDNSTNGPSGGGISTSSGVVSLTGSTLSGNSSSGDGFFGFRSGGGGGISASYGDVLLADSTLSGNSTSGDDAGGGGIYTRWGNVSLTNSTLSGNSTSGDRAEGGGIFTDRGQVLLTSSELSGNSTSGFRSEGGGIYSDFGKVLLMDSTLSENSTSGLGAAGGGIYASGGDVSIFNSTLSGNNTSGDGALGGAILAVRHGSVSLTNSTVSGNSTTGDRASGGAIAAFGSVGLSLVNSTVTGNSASGTTAGGINGGTSSLTIQNSIVANNTDSGVAPDLSFSSTGTQTINHSIIGTTDLEISGVRNHVGTLTNPTNPLLGPLADNGGPTLTHALLEGSPAIDAGTNSLAFDSGGLPLTTDQRGNGFDRIKMGRIDIGAFESDFDALPIPPSVISATIDEGGVLERPDLWNALTVIFNADVTIAAEDLSLFNDPSGGGAVDLSDVGFSYNSLTTTATWDFSTLDPLKPAFYSYRLDASSITNEGLVLDGNGDVTGGDNFEGQHYVAILGDANLDGVVDVLSDAATFVTNLGASSGAAWGQGDFTGDGLIDVLGDASTLVNNLGRDVRLPMMATAIAMAQPGPELMPTSTPVIVNSSPLNTKDPDTSTDGGNVSTLPSESTQLVLAGDHELRDDVFGSDF